MAIASPANADITDPLPPGPVAREGFCKMDRSVYAAHAALESDHWWFAARRRIVEAVIDTLVLPPKETARIYEIGCGTGGNLPMLNEHGRVYASEMDTEACAIAAGKGGDALIEQGYLPQEPRFEGETFDLLLMLDVLEHIPDDRAALETLKQHMHGKSRLLITVPAYKFLWSHHDVLNHHHRRYTRRALVDLLSQAGYEVKRATYFNTFLFPPVAFERLVISRLRKEQKEEVLTMPPRWLNRLVYSMFAAEAPLLKSGISFPFGISILALAELGETSPSV